MKVISDAVFFVYRFRAPSQKLRACMVQLAAFFIINGQVV